MASYSQPLPKQLRIGDTPFEFLGSVDDSSPYRYNDIGTDEYIAAGITAHLFYPYSLDDDKVIIKNRRVAIVKAAGIFDEPEKAMEWQCRNAGQGCDWWNAPYPITGDIAAILKTSLWQELGSPKEILPQKSDQDE